MRPRGRKDTFEDRNQEHSHMREISIEEQLMRPHGFFDVGDVAQVKYEMLRYVANGHSIDEALRAFGFSSRKSFYAARAAFEESGVAGLVSAKRSSRVHRQQLKNGPTDDSAPHARLQSIERSLERMQEELQEFGAPLAKEFVSDHLEIDFVMRNVRAGKRNIRLTPKEFNLLRYLVSQAGRAVPHKELLRAVWGPDSMDRFEALRCCVTYLRKKIEPDPSNPQYILTEPWVGYRFMTSTE
jgi:DNA-binding winged helix-turn-helix (wHTH) protein